MKISSNNISLFFTILLFFTGIWFCYDWHLEEVNLALCLFNFIPFLLFLAAYMLIRNLSEKSKIRIAVNIISSLILACYILFLYVMNFWIPVIYGIRNIEKYPSILKNNWRKDLVEHFPRKISVDAKDIRFFYRMGFMQGGSCIQLYYSTSPEKINELYERFSKMKTRSFQGGGKYEHINQGGMPTTNFYFENTVDHKFPDDYELMIFDWVPSEKEKKRRNLQISFNHGKSHGVAISKKRNKILYWAESW